ncbi:MAG: hypothetical protein ACM3ZF_16115 [Mycobacterium leprae]
MTAEDLPLGADHRRELLERSAIDVQVVRERGYRTISRPSAGDDRPRDELKRLNIASWAWNEDRFFPGLLIPIYSPIGERVGAQWKPLVAIRDASSA